MSSTNFIEFQPNFCLPHFRSPVFFISPFIFCSLINLLSLHYFSSFKPLSSSIFFRFPSFLCFVLRLLHSQPSHLQSLCSFLLLHRHRRRQRVERRRRRRRRGEDDDGDDGLTADGRQWQLCR
ncbi:hypothetical protein Dimus_038061 [Dionaea muscipula]